MVDVREEGEGTVLVAVEAYFEGGERCWAEGFWRYGGGGRVAGVANCRCLRRPVYRQGGGSFGHLRVVPVLVLFQLLDLGCW